MQRLLTALPGHRILLTHMTPTGRATARELFGDNPRVASVYLPYDYPFAVRRFLGRFAPDARPDHGNRTVAEPDRRSATTRHMPLLLVNARLSERSARGYRRLHALTREALGKLAAIAAQTGADAQRLQRTRRDQGEDHSAT